MTWYTWIEQGRDISMSPAVLEAVSDVLQLSEGERDYVYKLAGHTRPVERKPQEPLRAGEVQDLLDGLPERPAYCVDRYWTVLARNQLAHRVFDIDVGDNCLEQFFTRHEVASRYPFREETARMLISQFREHTARFSADPRFAAMAARLSERSDSFAVLWQSYVVGIAPQLNLVFDHPDVGRLSFTARVLTPFDDDERRIFIYLPRHHTPTASALRSLQ